MKYYISTPNQFLSVYDFLGNLVPGVIEYDDETKEVKMYIINSEKQIIKINSDGLWTPVVVTTVIPGSKIEL
jgi:hypothetical protein